MAVFILLYTNENIIPDLIFEQTVFIQNPVNFFQLLLIMTAILIGKMLGKF